MCVQEACVSACVLARAGVQYLVKELRKDVALATNCNPGLTLNLPD